jgi:hypothetical protein
LAAGPGRKPWGSTIDQRTSAARAAHGARVRAAHRAAAEAQRARRDPKTCRRPRSRAITTTASSAGSPSRASVAPSAQGALGPARPTTTTRSIAGSAGDRRGGHHHRGQDDERAHGLGMRDRGARRKPRAAGRRSARRDDHRRGVAAIGAVVGVGAPAPAR